MKHSEWIPVASVGQNRRPTSTKTRIETTPCIVNSYSQVIADRHPLKQGLKPHYRPLRCAAIYGIADRHPLKQGLKLDSMNETSGTDPIADRHPLKQGLKQEVNGTAQTANDNRRPTSTKTRIETYIIGDFMRGDPGIADRHPLKQGLKL